MKVDMKNKTILLLSIIIVLLLILIAGLFKLVLFHSQEKQVAASQLPNVQENEPLTIDYAKAYYDYLQQSKYGSGFDWSEAQLVDLDQDNVPELVAAYGNFQTMLYDMEYYNGSQEPTNTGSLSIFVYKDGTISEIKEPEVFDLGTMHELGNSKKMSLVFNTGFNLQGQRGNQNKNVYLTEVEDRTLLCVYQNLDTSHSGYQGIIAYSLDEKKSLKKEISLIRIFNDTNSDVSSNNYYLNGAVVSEQKFTEYMEKMKPNEQNFTILEEGSDGGDTEGQAVYSLDAQNYTYGNILKSLFFEEDNKSYSHKLATLISESQMLYDNNNLKSALDKINDALLIDSNTVDALVLKAKITLKDDTQYKETKQLLHHVLILERNHAEAIELKEEVDRELEKIEMLARNTKVIKTFLDTGELDVFDGKVDLTSFTSNDMKNLYGEPNSEGLNEADDLLRYYYYYDNFIFVDNLEEDGDVSAVYVDSFAGITDTNGLVWANEIAGQIPGSTNSDIKELFGEKYNETGDAVYEVSRTSIIGGKGNISITYDYRGNVCEILLYTETE